MLAAAFSRAGRPSSLHAVKSLASSSSASPASTTAATCAASTTHHQHVHALASFSTSSSSSSVPPRGKTSKLVLGCGSNVVDKYYPVRRWPKEGTKGFFLEENVCSARVVGGVTLNHLVWARALGTPTGLLALQGTDDNGVVR